MIAVADLNAERRPALEAVLCECLIVSNRARATAQTAGGGGRDQGAAAAADDARMDAAVRESFARLPDELPKRS